MVAVDLNRLKLLRRDNERTRIRCHHLAAKIPHDDNRIKILMTASAKSLLRARELGSRNKSGHDELSLNVLVLVRETFQ
jgi:hypothetical protein